MIMLSDNMNMNVKGYTSEVTPAWMKADNFDKLLENQPRKKGLRNRLATMLHR